MDTDSLNRAFSIPEELMFVAGPGGLIQARIENGHATAVVATYAGQVLSYKPAGGTELLFLSDAAYFEAGKATKGGIPICWPWFGPDPECLGRPSHGLVRNRQWQVIETASVEGATRIVLGVGSNDVTRALWPHDFELRIEITVGKDLHVDLRTINIGSEEFLITQGLHTYFRVGDITDTYVTGLEGCRYVDKVDANAEKLQSGPVIIDGEVDRIYKNVDSILTVEDGASRRIRITATGSQSAVVWNPWEATAHKMADLDDDDFTRMLCVETTNAGDDVIEVKPGHTHSLSARFALESA